MQGVRMYPSQYNTGEYLAMAVALETYAENYSNANAKVGHTILLLHTTFVFFFLAKSIYMS